MHLGLWIALGISAWVVLPLPLAMLIGRFIRSGEKPAVVPAQALVIRPVPARRFEKAGQVSQVG